MTKVIALAQARQLAKAKYTLTVVVKALASTHRPGGAW